VPDTDADADADADAGAGRADDSLSELDPETLRADGDARIDYLVEAGLLTVTSNGDLTPTESFGDARAVYVDSYKDVDDETFHRTVSEVFNIPREEAADRVAELDLTRWELATYFAVRSELGSDVDLPPDVLLELSAVMAAAGEASAVPPEMSLLPESYEDFLASEGDAVVFVYARECDPCKRMKSELADTLVCVPDGVTVVGADGADVPDLRWAFEVDVAPTTLVFAGGDLHEKLEGYKSTERLGEAFDAAY